MLSDKEIVKRVLEILYWDPDENKWDTEKEWDPEFLDMIAEQVLQSKNLPRGFGGPKQWSPRA